MAELEIIESNLPFNIDAEQIVIGSVIVEPELLSKISDIITPDHFHIKMHSGIYSVIQKLFVGGENINIVTVTENCVRQSVFESQDAARTYLFRLSEMSVEKASIESYAQVLDEKYLMRRLITASKDIFDKAIVPRLDSWKKYVDTAGSENAERALSRSVVMHLHEAMDEDDAYAPDEFYVSNLEDSDYVKPGEVLRRKTEGSPSQYVVVISPACDLALHGNPCKPKSDVVQVCELEAAEALLKSVGGCISKSVAKESKKAGDDAETVQKKSAAAVRSFNDKVFSNQYTLYYHYFPAAVDFDGFVMNFRRLKTHTHAEISNEYVKTGYIVSPNFFRDIQSRFAAYYGRQGQPVICVVR